MNARLEIPLNNTDGVTDTIPAPSSYSQVEPDRGRSAHVRRTQFGQPAALGKVRGLLQNAWRWVGPPILAFLGGQLLLATSAYLYGFNWLNPESRVRWDGGIYLDIAKTGYYILPCTAINPEITDAGAICGNAGWFPLYPYLVLGLTEVTGLDLASAGVLITEACALGTLIMLWHLLGATTRARRVACLSVAATLPAGVYFHATFPMALSVLLTLLTFALLTRGRWLLAGLAGAGSAMSYPLAVLLTPAAAALVLAAPNRWSWRRLGRAAYVGGLTCSGVIAFFGLLQLATGRFDAFLEIQANYSTQRVNNPVSTLVVWVAHSKPAISAEMLFSIALLILAVAGLAQAMVTQKATALDRTLTVAYGPILLLFTLTYGTSHSQYRSHTLLLPLVLLLRHLPTPVVAALAVIGTPLAFVLTGLYLTRILV